MKARQRILWFLVAVWTCVVLFLTLQSGPDTAETSGWIARWLHRLLTACGFRLAFDPFHMLLRTAAHFVIYFVFGLLFELAMLASLQRSRFLNACLPALLAGAALSVIPEGMKLWIPGRHLQWDEVGLNLCGAFAGALLVYLVYRILLFRKER